MSACSFWRYILNPEETGAPWDRPAVTCLARAAKTLFWLTISVLLGLGVGQMA
ncbi:hypothetical protein [Pseudodesulfovibrio indicus]|uniref:hypothetical protein n=1 Tax=Pseudodesulfovibrio indicus TaxID=1716143 RepID=UPI00292E527D|nr:hypothetical protein [Pseudodesulfovibrio indicus]